MSYSMFCQTGGDWECSLTFERPFVSKVKETNRIKQKAFCLLTRHSTAEPHPLCLLFGL